MNKIDNRRLKIWSVVYNRPMYVKISDVIKGLVFLLSLKYIIRYGRWLEVLEPDKNNRHATYNGKQRKTV
jgi:hypothetical protein